MGRWLLGGLADGFGNVANLFSGCAVCLVAVLLAVAALIALLA
jgi:hypothetical protein